MASVLPPAVARHPSPFRRAYPSASHPHPHRPSSSTTTSISTSQAGPSQQQQQQPPPPQQQSIRAPSIPKPSGNPTSNVTANPTSSNSTSQGSNSNTAAVPVAAPTTNTTAATAAATTTTTTTATTTTKSSSTGTADPYYGHKETAVLCSRFVTSIFNCPDHAPTPAPSSTTTSTSSTPSPTLSIFIAYALHRTRLHSSVTFTALYLLQRLKLRFPAARGSSGHRLFLSAFMIASKVVCDDTYSNKSWTVVGQGLFALREVNQMEREMCAYLEWGLNVCKEELASFEKDVRKLFSGEGPYPSSVQLLSGGGNGLSVKTGGLVPETAADKKDKDGMQLPTPTDMGLTHTPFPPTSASSPERAKVPAQRSASYPPANNTRITLPPHTSASAAAAAATVANARRAFSSSSLTPPNSPPRHGHHIAHHQHQQHGAVMHESPSRRPSSISNASTPEFVDSATSSPSPTSSEVSLNTPPSYNAVNGGNKYGVATNGQGQQYPREKKSSYPLAKPNIVNVSVVGAGMMPVNPLQFNSAASIVAMPIMVPPHHQHHLAMNMDVPMHEKYRSSTTVTARSQPPPYEEDEEVDEDDEVSDDGSVSDDEMRDWNGSKERKRSGNPMKSKSSKKDSTTTKHQQQQQQLLEIKPIVAKTYTVACNW